MVSEEKQAEKRVEKGQYTWSYSSLDLYKQCPHKYYRIKVKKDVVDPPTPHIRYGLDFHKAAEEFVRDRKPMPERFDFAKGVVEKLDSIQGEKLCEKKLGLRRDLSPCDFFAKDVWWRGIADLIILQPEKERAFVVDYKTGKSAKYASVDQLEILSLAVFKHFPQVKSVKGGLAFVVANDFVNAAFDAGTADIKWTKWLEGTSQLEQSIELGVWNPRQNFTCRKWCPVKDCPHNGV